MTRRFVAACALVLGVGAAAPIRAASEDVPILGGTQGVSRALGLEPTPDRARFVVELTRAIYDVPEGSSATTDAVLKKLTKHLDTVDRFQAALAKVQPGDRGIALAMAGQKNDRDRLKEFLDLIGLKLRERNKAFTVEQTDNKQGAERVKELASIGVNLTQLAARLNKGEAVRVAVSTETVPIPLPAKIWSEAIFQRPVTGTALFSAIMSDRRAALLCHGLFALDDETVQFLADRPALLARLYEHDAGPFAAFAGALRVRANTIQVPGGAAAVPLWEAAVDEKIDRPDRFVRELFGHDAGRTAYLYDSLSRLDPARRSFALGLWMPDPSARRDRFKALASSLGGFPVWDVPERPFTRPPDDVVLMLMRVAADDRGEPLRPSWWQFWNRAFDSANLPDDPARQLRNLQEGGRLDAASLSQFLLNADVRSRAERLDQLAFGQRVFLGLEDAALPEALVAVRAFARYRMLMLTIERMGVRKPAVYAAAAQQAARLSALSPTPAFIALTQFQGAMAVVAQLRRTQVIDLAAAEGLVSSLAAASLDDDGRYDGAIARWIKTSLQPALHDTGRDVDAVLVPALAGQDGRPLPPSIVRWEGRAYRVDLVTPEARRVKNVLEKLKAEPLNRALAFERLAETLGKPAVSLAEVQSVITELKTLTPRVPSAKDKRLPGVNAPPGVDAPKDPGEIVKSAIQDLSKIKNAKDLKRAARVAPPLFALVDDLSADALLAVVYALHLGDADGTALAAGNVSHRHDFGFTEHDKELRLRAPWTEPVQKTAPGTPWRVTGSLLGLDLGLANLSLRRISSETLSRAPSLAGLERDAFIKTVALFNPFEARDADRDAVADAIRRGQRRVEELARDAAGFDALADEVGMDGWRRRDVRWTLINEPDRAASFFSMTDFLYLGKPVGVDVDVWGVSSGPFDGCLCARVAPPGRWTLAVGRPRNGLLSASVSDLTLRVALSLSDAKLPAALAPGVLAAATQDFVDGVKLLHRNDWLTLARFSQVVAARFDDYVAALTADGPLVPAE